MLYTSISFSATGSCGLHVGLLYESRHTRTRANILRRLQKALISVDVLSEEQHVLCSPSLLNTWPKSRSMVCLVVQGPWGA
jgi:hypothetical protein